MLLCPPGDDDGDDDYNAGGNDYEHEKKSFLANLSSYLVHLGMMMVIDV